MEGIVMTKFIKNILKIAFIITAVSITNIAFSADDWPEMMENYKPDEGFQKPVTGKEYDDALKTIDKVINKKKEPKEPRNAPKPMSKGSESFSTDGNDSLLKFTHNLYYENTTIPVGFYKLQPKKEDNNYYIELTQGKTVIVKVKANKVKHTYFCEDKLACIKTETINDKYLKIFYKDMDVALVGYLLILK